jgi:simple sugar transport system permease protein
MMMSGSLYGTAGAFSVLGIHHMAIQGATAGLGWNGIAVALIGANHPLMIIPAGLVFAFLEEAAATATLSSSISLELSSIVQGMVFLLITVRFARKRWRKR